VTRLASGAFPPSEKKRKYRAVVRRDGESCARCSTTDNLTLDHIVPRSRGGSNRIVNLQLLCGPCNQAKGDTLDEALITKQRLRPILRPLHYPPPVKAPPPIKAPRVKSSRHLAGCDATYCMYGCPAYKAPRV
jgi:hypothetical protein